MEIGFLAPLIPLTLWDYGFTNADSGYVAIDKNKHVCYNWGIVRTFKICYCFEEKLQNREYRRKKKWVRKIA